MKEIIEKHKNRINTIIRKFTGSNNEDLEQEIYIKTWKGLDKYNEQSKFSQWVNTIAANLCRDYLKSSQNKFSSQNIEIYDNSAENIKDKTSPEQELASKERQKIILKAVYSLPKKQKDVIILYEFEEKSYEDISKKLKVPVGTVKSRLASARKTLSEKLEFLKGDQI